LGNPLLIDDEMVSFKSEESFFHANVGDVTLFADK